MYLNTAKYFCMYKTYDTTLRGKYMGKNKRPPGSYLHCNHYYSFKNQGLHRPTTAKEAIKYWCQSLTPEKIIDIKGLQFIIVLKTKTRIHEFWSKHKDTLITQLHYQFVVQ